MTYCDYKLFLFGNYLTYQVLFKRALSLFSLLKQGNYSGYNIYYEVCFIHSKWVLWHSVFKWTT